MESALLFLGKEPSLEAVFKMEPQYRTFVIINISAKSPGALGAERNIEFRMGILKKLVFFGRCLWKLPAEV